MFNVKKWLYLFLGILGIVMFVLQIFAFESLDGFINYLVCLFSILLTVISFIKLYQVSKIFREFLHGILELL